MMGWYGGGMGAGAWVFMGLFWLALIAVIVWLVVRLLPERSGSTPPSPSHTAPTPETPLEILDKRLARGEIDVETYTALRRALLEGQGGAR